MRGLKYLLLLSLASAGLLLSGPAARADSYTFVFTNPYQSAVVGDTVEFDATIINLDSSNGLYLNGDSMAWLDSPLTYDDTAFWTLAFSAPLNPAGDPGDSYTGALFDVTVPLGTAAGTYEGEYQVLGGSSPGASDLLADQDFTITVGSEASPVPEPSGLVLLLTGLAGLAGTLRRRLIR
jgi:hypothetical protein